ncbi:MAG: hypothetical protein ACREFN_15430 [Acetobacteraceae bacterium]
MLAHHATHPTGGYSTEAGIMEMLTRMRDGRFKIRTATIEWQEEFQGYYCRNGPIVKANDDLLSATRIGVMQLRSAKPVGLGSTRRRGRGPEIAEGTDFDLFTGQ